MGVHPIGCDENLAPSGGQDMPAERRVPGHTCQLKELQLGPTNYQHVDSARKDFFVGTKGGPAKRQSIYTIPRQRGTEPSTGRVTRPQPTHNKATNAQRLQQASLTLTCCPHCLNANTLSESATEGGYQITCGNCGTLPKISGDIIRKRQVCIIQTALEPHHRHGTAIAPQSKPNTSNTNPTQQHTTAMNDKHDTGDDPPTPTVNHTHDKDGDVVVNDEAQGRHTHYEGETGDGSTVEEPLDASWFTTAFRQLDENWVARFSRLEGQLNGMQQEQKKNFDTLTKQQQDLHSQQTAKTNKLASQLTEESTRAREEADRNNRKINRLIQGQEDLLVGQDAQKSALEELKADIIQDLQGKLENTANTIQQAQEATKAYHRENADSYADKAARPPAGPQPNNRPPLDYFKMPKRTTSNRPAATPTNGQLVRIYVRDWRKEPVGAVKRALRIVIAEWESQRKMGDNNNNDTATGEDLDAVRHLNQFGTPEVPLMEIACTQERSGAVREFFHDSDIVVWADNTNPLLAPDTPADDKSLPATRRHHGHCIRVLNAWWKGAHYVQNRDTAAYYMRILDQVVHNAESPHAWPPYVTGINIDARGVTVPKDNPKITYDYVEGFKAPLDNSKHNTPVAIRSFATGGVPPPGKAVKRPRESGETTGNMIPKTAAAAQADLPIMSIDDIRTPAPTNLGRARTDPNRAGGAGPSDETDTANADSPPYRLPPIDQQTPSRMLSPYYGDANPPPATPVPTPSHHVQVSQSGRKLPAQGPRAGSRTSGVEQHD